MPAGFRSSARSDSTPPFESASSVRISPSSSELSRLSIPLTVSVHSAGKPDELSRPRISSPSRPTGAATRNLRASAGNVIAGTPSGELRIPGQHAGKSSQPLTNAHLSVPHQQLAYGALMRTGPAFHHRERLAHLSACFKVPKQKHVVGKITHVSRRGNSMTQRAAVPAPGT